MGSYAVLGILLSITTFYLFLSMYILARAIGNRSSSNSRRKKPMRPKPVEGMRIGRPLW